MAKKNISSGKELKGFLLSRFFFVLAIVSVVELIVVGITNTYLIPALVVFTRYNKIIKIDGAEGLFMLVFVLVATWLVNRIFPMLNASPVAVNEYLEKILQSRGFVGASDQEVTETLHALSNSPMSLLSLIGSFFLVAIILLTPYIIGGIVFSISVAREIRRFEREKETEHRKDEERRYLMISNIVHDLKTPMTTVYGYAKALNDGIVPDDKKPEYLDAIMNKTTRTNEVIALLLDYVKLDSEGFVIKRSKVDISELVRSCCALLYTDIESAGDEIDINVPEKPLYVSADSVQMTRVITNLITNAVRHNPEGTKISVQLKCENYATAEDVRIFVADTGDEIPSPFCDQIFEPFVTGDESRASGSGTGLGLPLSVKICEMHGFRFKLVQIPEIKRYHLGDEYRKAFVISM
ncbi:MAG: HAMP domain-containing sensor histidine kinase [Saccharofermentans sp.]|nr:HAMP domain-containing sensor histidine kinase [Saccharofermentans sp.]